MPPCSKSNTGSGPAGAHTEKDPAVIFDHVLWISSRSCCYFSTGLFFAKAAGSVERCGSRVCLCVVEKVIDGSRWGVGDIFRFFLQFPRFFSCNFCFGFSMVNPRVLAILRKLRSGQDFKDTRACNSSLLLVTFWHFV